MFRQKHIFLMAIACSLALHLASFGLYVEYAHLHGLGRFASRTTTDKPSPPPRRLMS